MATVFPSSSLVVPPSYVTFVNNCQRISGDLSLKMLYVILVLNKNACFWYSYLPVDRCVPPNRHHRHIVILRSGTNLYTLNLHILLKAMGEALVGIERHRCPNICHWNMVVMHFHPPSRFRSFSPSWSWCFHLVRTTLHRCLEAWFLITSVSLLKGS